MTRWTQYDIELGALTPRFYGRLAAAAQELRGEFFFLHKPPGMRLRATSTMDLFGTPWRPGRYTPEADLFGAEHMDAVHRIFTADSLVWLRHHAEPAPVSATWALSLRMIRALVDGLDVAGVFRRVGGDLGRALSSKASQDPVVGALRRQARELWDRAEPAPEPYAEVVRSQVRTERSVAPMIVFHWNRARLPLGHQALITHELAEVRP